MTIDCLGVYHPLVSRVIKTVPAANTVLCEGCGYILDGLPDNGRCPECAKPLVESNGPHVRTPPAWEQPVAGAPLQRFLHTTLAVLFRPTHFYRTITTRAQPKAANDFAQIHFILASTILGATLFGHLNWYCTRLLGLHPLSFLLILPASIACWIAFTLITRLAARLSAWEAAYRGMRLPLAVVRRGLAYHAVHYLPVCLVAALTVFGHSWLLTTHRLADTSFSPYLYTLCAEVILSSIYLFSTYWIAMRNMMYANQ